MAPASSEQGSTPAHTRPASGHLPALDGIRGLATLMVVCSHAFESGYNGHGRFISLIGNFFYYGLFGVDLFFVLSGFLITGILFDSLQDNGYFRKFYARRALRIFPLYYGVLLVCFLLTSPLHLHWGDMGWLLVFYLQNLHPRTIMFFSPGMYIGLYHFWSLAVEEQFYLIWPAIIYWVRDRRKLLIVMLVGSAGSLLLRVVIMLAHGSAYAMHVTMFCRADSLMMGGALAMLYRSSIWPRIARIAPWSFLAFGTLLVLSIVYLEQRYLYNDPAMNTFWRATFRYSLLAVVFTSLIAWSLKQGSVCQSLFKVSGLRFIGKYSYGIYVLHIFILDVLLIPVRNSLDELTHNKLIGVVGSAVISLGIAVLAAMFSYHFYEKPFLRLKHYFDYKRDSLNHGAQEDAEARV